MNPPDMTLVGVLMLVAGFLAAEWGSARANARVAALVTLLRNIEWAAGERDEDCCPYCDATRGGRGHDYDCALAIAIGSPWRRKA